MRSACSIADQLADHPLVERPLHGAEERRVAQHVGDGHAAAAARGGLGHRTHAVRRRSDRLLEDDVVAGGERGDGRLGVIAVRGGDDDNIRRAVVRQELAPVAERLAIGESVIGSESGAPFRIRIGDGHDLRLVGMLQAPAPVRAASPVTGADDGDPKRVSRQCRLPFGAGSRHRPASHRPRGQDARRAPPAGWP